MVSFKKVKDKLFTLVQNKIVQDFNGKFLPWAITYYHTLKMKIRFEKLDKFKNE